MRLAWCLLLVAGCAEAPDKSARDRDGDGIAEADDCDDADADVGVARAWFGDADRDGHGDQADAVTACSRPEGYASGNDDCDDQAATVYTGAPEACDGLDNDCDGLSDLDDPDLDPESTQTVYVDADGDGYGEDGTGTTACGVSAGQSLQDGDCADADAGRHPGAAESCNGVDDDCDTLADDLDPDAEGTVWYEDSDGDGHGDARSTLTRCDPPPGWVEPADDCDDTDARIHPGADEPDCADRTDYNCDGSTGYADNDHDGHAACEDCDDADGDVHPGADEACNGRDDDCDGQADDAAVDAPAWYTDADGDGAGDPATGVLACSAPAGAVANADDCDDTTAQVGPTATERCNGLDDDCDAVVDEDDAADATTWYADADGDGHGDPAGPHAACAQPAGYAATDDDCDDLAAAVNPGATERCNGLDDDCDAEVDEDDAADALSFYGDADGDGYGDPADLQRACAQPTGSVANDDDCDDVDAAVSPAAVERCNAVDDDCDGHTDEDDAVDAVTWYADVDGDGYGHPGATRAACAAPSGHVRDATDCDDLSASVHPGVPEHCDDVDEDCDGTVDDNPVDPADWYPDVDGDGYGDEAATPIAACDGPADYVVDATDCEDTLADANPGETESCDTVDNDCDGQKDESGCPCTTAEYGGHVYMYCTSTATWSAAQATCLLYGYELVAIGSAAENVEVVGRAAALAAARWWMGFNDQTHEGTWSWSSGATVSYTNWHSGEPNDASGEDCGELYRWSDYTWNDMACTDTLRFICEE